MFTHENCEPEDIARILNNSDLLSIISDALTIPDETGTVDP